MSRIPPKPEAREGNVKRSVVGATPEIGKISRISTEPRRRRTSTRSKSKGSSRHRQRFSKVLTNWLILVLSLVGLTFGYVLLWSFFEQKDAGQFPMSQADEVPNLPSDRALSMVEAMLAAPNADELEKLIRPGQLSTQQAFDYLESLRNKKSEPSAPVWIGPIDSLSVPFELVSIHYSGAVPRSALFTPNEHGEWKLDFDAFAQLCVPKFVSLLEGKENEGLVRVHIVKDSYFNAYFKTDADWDCYILIKPGVDTNLYGYCRRGSIAHTAMEALHQRVLQHTSSPEESPSQQRPTASRATLYLKRPSGAETRQFEITQVISDEWVISDKPLDERLAEKSDK